MSYTFNYKEFAKKHNDLVKGKRDYRIVDGKIKRFSMKLNYCLRNNTKAQFLLPRQAVCFDIDITNDYKIKAGKILFNKGFFDYEIIGSFANTENAPVAVNKNNGHVILFDTCFGGNEFQFINSSIEQFAESILFHAEFMKCWDQNEKSGISEFDCITEDMVIDLFAKIERIDAEGAKNGNFWHGYISQDILCYEGHKMVAQNRMIKQEGDYYSYSIETIPTVLDLPAWKVLNP